MPQSQNGYSYVNNNPINKTDPTGLCAENFDEGCWAVYEQIIRLCPECAQMKRPWLGGYRYLHEEDVGYLQTKLAEVRNGWRPSFDHPVDGISIYVSEPLVTPGLDGVGGIEVLYNLQTRQYTAFAVAGGSFTLGGALKVCGQINQVYGIDDDNLLYRGQFVYWSLSASYGLGFTVGRAWTPSSDGFWPFNFLSRDEDGAYSGGIGPTFGVGASASLGIVEYIPLFTHDTQNQTTEFLADWYLFEDDTKWWVGRLFRNAMLAFLFAGYVDADPNASFLRTPGPPGLPDGTPTPPETPTPQSTPPPVPVPVP